MKLNSGKYTEERELLRDTMKWLTMQSRSGIRPIRICDRYTKGISDILACVNGMFVAIELKDDTGTASPQQLSFIKDIQAAGGVGGVCRTVQDVADLIEEAKRRTDHWMRMP